MGFIKGFDRIKEERKNLSFFKIFQSADLYSENMRAFPYSFITRLSDKDFSYKMVIRVRWGSSWEIGVSKNPRFYYMEKHGWNKFVSDNALGENQFVTFTHKGKMCFNANIYEPDGKEMLTLRKLKTLSEVKKEPGESNYKDVKKEEETGESPGEVREKRAEETKTSIKKKKIKSERVVNSVVIGDSTGGVKRRGRKKKDDETKTSKKRKIKSKKKNAVREFTVTIRKSYLKFLGIPKRFVHIPSTSKIVTIYNSGGNYSWEVLCLVRENRAIFSSGWSKMAREYPLLVDDICTFKLISPTEFLLIVTKKD